MVETPEDNKSLRTIGEGKQEVKITTNPEEPDLPKGSYPNKSQNKGREMVQEKQKIWQQFQLALCHKLTPGVWISSEAIVRWLSGRNRHDPCHRLSSFNSYKIQEWIGHRHTLTSCLQECPYIIWRQGKKTLNSHYQIWSLNKKTHKNEISGIIPPQSQLPVLIQKGKRIIPRHSRVQHEDLYLVSRFERVRRTSPDRSQQSKEWNWSTVLLIACLVEPLHRKRNKSYYEQKKDTLLRDLREFHKPQDDHSPQFEVEGEMYQEVRQWFIEQEAGPFLDKIRKMVRRPEGQELVIKTSFRLRIMDHLLNRLPSLKCVFFLTSRMHTYV